MWRKFWFFPKSRLAGVPHFARGLGVQCARTARQGAHVSMDRAMEQGGVPRGRVCGGRGGWFRVILYEDGRSETGFPHHVVFQQPGGASWALFSRSGSFKGSGRVNNDLPKVSRPWVRGGRTGTVAGGLELGQQPGGSVTAAPLPF